MENTRTTIIALFWGLLLFVGPSPADATVIFGNIGLSNGFRWDAAPRTFNGLERSLDGGLRYSLQTGSYAGYRDLFTWQGAAPTVFNFQRAIEGAFNAWTLADPVSGLGTDLFFRADLGTTAHGTGFGGVNPAGAEIDLLASTNTAFWDLGDSGQQGMSFFDTGAGGVTLTSGTVGYSGRAISGADITLNNNPQAAYSLISFQLLLTHEIGHALGLGDVEFDINPRFFIDDNFDGRSSATARNTLTNSWARLVDPFDPSASPLFLFDVPNADPGIDTSGVNILMESSIPSALFGNSTPLGNDDFGGRQFLYPFVLTPEPSSILLVSTGLTCIFLYRWRMKGRNKKPFSG